METQEYIHTPFIIDYDATYSPLNDELLRNDYSHTGVVYISRTRATMALRYIEPRNIRIMPESIPFDILDMREMLH